MSQTDVAISVLRRSFLRRINFAFPNGKGGYYSVDGGLFAGTADKIAVGDNTGQMSVEIDSALDSAGETDYPVIFLREALNGRLMESVLCHESLHADLYCNDLGKNVVDNYEEAACYTVNVMFYLMTGLTKTRWLTYDPVNNQSAAIKKAALPVAYAILDSNANAASTYIIDPADFQPVVAEVAKVYSDNGAGGTYPRLGDPPSP